MAFKGERTFERATVSDRLTRARRFAIGIGATWALLPERAAAQALTADSSAMLAGIVIAAESGAPLGYSVVSIPALGEAGRERYTTAEGRFVFPDLPTGTHRVRVKHLGYAPRDVDVRLSPGRTEIRVELTRVVVRLAAVRVVAREDCTRPGPPDARVSPDFATVFEQVRLNAERLRLLVDRYPYHYFAERSFYDELRNGESRLLGTDTVGFQSQHGWRYRPGRIISSVAEGRGREYVMILPGLIDIVDTAFLANHCFRYAGLDTIGGRIGVRIDFYAAKKLRGPDADGAVYLDTATFQIRGTRIALTRPPATLRGIQGMTATTIFEEAVPSIPIPSYVVGTRILRARGGARAPVARIEKQSLLEVRFLREIPGNLPSSAAPPRG